MVRRYRANDNASTTLNGSVTASDTTWVLADGSVFPSEGDFFLVCEGEIVLATARTTNTITVTRAQGGTTNVAHASGKTVRTIVTKEDIEGRLIENNLLRAAPYGVIMTQAGTILTASDFTELNSGTGSSIVDGLDGTIEYRCRNHASDNLSGIVRDFTANTDFDLYCHISIPWMDTDPWNGASGTNRSFGLWARQNTGGTLKGASIYPGKSMAAQSRASFLGGATNDAVHGAEGRYAVWLKMTMRWNVGGNDANDQMTFSYSWDSFNWVSFPTYSFASSSMQVGMLFSNFGLAGWPIHLNYWYEDTTV